MVADSRVAVFGVGQFGAEHVRVLNTGTGSRCVAVIDVDQRRASDAARRYSVPHSFGSVADAVAWGEFDAACIATPAATHVDVAGAVAATGAALLIEKPILQSATDSHRLRRIASRVPVLPAHVSRFAELYREPHRRIMSGEIGSVRWISARRYRRRDHAFRFGESHIAHTTMIHDIDLAMWFSGTSSARLVSATGAHVLGLPNADHVSATFQTNTGVTWRLDASWLMTDPRTDTETDAETTGLDTMGADRIEVFGTEGQLVVDVSNGFDLDAALAGEHLELASLARRETAFGTVTLEEGLAGIALADEVAARTGVSATEARCT